ncbi:hypothetical protein BC828DRAFT_403164 [Blastocladiella britannica]|nr:hypothetical protein BC828DRAFT_403164 [Blastocladiella britannica]
MRRDRPATARIAPSPFLQRPALASRFARHTPAARYNNDDTITQSPPLDARPSTTSRFWTTPADVLTVHGSRPADGSSTGSALRSSGIPQSRYFLSPAPPERPPSPPPPPLTYTLPSLTMDTRRMTIPRPLAPSSQPDHDIFPLHRSSDSMMHIEPLSTSSPSHPPMPRRRFIWDSPEPAASRPQQQFRLAPPPVFHDMPPPPPPLVTRPVTAAPRAMQLPSLMAAGAPMESMNSWPDHSQPATRDMVPIQELMRRHGDQLPIKFVAELAPRFQGLFSFPSFNFIQSACYDVLVHSDTSLAVSAPTGSGKTVLLDLALVRVLQLGNPNAKAVYLAPTKSLCSERMADWSRRLRPLGVQVAELTGDSDYSTSLSARSAQVLVTTPEKFDSWTRRWRDVQATVAGIAIMLIDEVHVLSTSRGPTLEAVVSRAKVIAAELGRPIRFVAISATIPNVADIGAWLGPGTVVRSFGEEYRPVTLEKHVIGYPTQGRSQWQFDRMLDAQLPNVVQQHATGRPALVFCPTRKSTEQSAKLIVDQLCRGGGRRQHQHPFVRTDQQARVLEAAVSQCRSSVLRELLDHGVAFHHAGLDASDRALVETAFLQAHLLVICTTSTLAMGVNLPCHLVIIKARPQGTTMWDNGITREYASSDVLQMLGRAGRPQFDTTGKAIIMTSAAMVDQYEKLVGGSDTVESTLHRQLAEHLNTEIAQGTVRTDAGAVTWLTGTFLNVRWQRDPDQYGRLLPGNDLPGLVEATLRELGEAGMVEFQHLAPETTPSPIVKVACTDLGRIMSKYCLSVSATRALADTCRSIPQILYTLAGSRELAGTSTALKQADRAIIAELNGMSDIKFRLPARSSTSSTSSSSRASQCGIPADKVFLVIQAVLGNMLFPGKEHDKIRYAVQSEAPGIWAHVCRHARAALEVQMLLARTTNRPADNNDTAATQSEGVAMMTPMNLPLTAADGIRHAALLLQSFKAKLWYDSPRVLKQLEGIGPQLSAQLASAGITSFACLLSAMSQKVEAVCKRNPPFGSKLVAAAGRLPQFALSITSTDDHRECLGVVVTLDVSNRRMLSARHKDAPSSAVFLVHDELGRVHVATTVSWAALKQSSIATRVSVRAVPRRIFASVICQDFVGLDRHAEFDTATGTAHSLPMWQLPNAAFAPPDLDLPSPARPTKSLPPPPASSGMGTAQESTYQPGGSPRIDSGAGGGSFPQTTTTTTTGSSIFGSTTAVVRVPATGRNKNKNGPCKHKCRDKSKCSHVCCKRGTETVDPAPAAIPPFSSRRGSVGRVGSLQHVFSDMSDDILLQVSRELLEDGYAGSDGAAADDVARKRGGLSTWLSSSPIPVRVALDTSPTWRSLSPLPLFEPIQRPAPAVTVVCLDSSSDEDGHRDQVTLDPVISPPSPHPPSPHPPSPRPPPPRHSSGSARSRRISASDSIHYYHYHPLSSCTHRRRIKE